MTEPTTAAGRVAVGYLAGLRMRPAADAPDVIDHHQEDVEFILAIEAEARAAALDEARSAVERCHTYRGGGGAIVITNPFLDMAEALAAIDALREDADKP